MFIEKEKIHKSWLDFFTNDIENELENIEKQIGDNYFPSKENILRFMQLDLNKVKYIIVGMEPYPSSYIENNQVIGIVTDGDIRRMLNNRDTFADLTAQDIMTKNPKNINSSILVSEALNILENNSITQLVVIDNNEYKGILHLHDILKEGIV